jgi:hypothetical protein
MGAKRRTHGQSETPAWLCHFDPATIPDDVDVPANAPGELSAQGLPLGPHDKAYFAWKAARRQYFRQFTGDDVVPGCGDGIDRLQAERQQWFALHPEVAPHRSGVK